MGPAPISITVTVSDTIETTTTVTNYVTKSLTGTMQYSIEAPSQPPSYSYTRPEALSDNLSLGAMRLQSIDGPLAGGNYIYHYNQSATVSGILTTNGTKSVPVTVSFTKTATGETSVPVVQGIKLRIHKVNMWALTNSLSSPTTTEITIYDATDTTSYQTYHDF